MFQKMLYNGVFDLTRPVCIIYHNGTQGGRAVFFSNNGNEGLYSQSNIPYKTVLDAQYVNKPEMQVLGDGGNNLLSIIINRHCTVFYTTGALTTAAGMQTSFSSMEIQSNQVLRNYALSDTVTNFNMAIFVFDPYY